MSWNFSRIFFLPILVIGHWFAEDGDVPPQARVWLRKAHEDMSTALLVSLGRWEMRQRREKAEGGKRRAS